MKILLLLIHSFFIYADDFNPKTDIIADNYDAGSYLIYDCTERHWTCVQESFYKECQIKRARSIASSSASYHPCAPIGLFPTKRACFQRQLFLITHNHADRFCLREDLKTKAIEH